MDPGHRGLLNPTPFTILWLGAIPYQGDKEREVDAVIELPDSQWCAFEIKMGAYQINAAHQHLDRVLVVPITALKNPKKSRTEGFSVRNFSLRYYGFEGDHLTYIWTIQNLNSNGCQSFH